MEETEQKNQDDHNSDDHYDDTPTNERSSSEQVDTLSENEPSKNKGNLIVDATCAPADIAYPTD